MAHYLLTARKGDNTDQVALFADTETEGTIRAISYIMEKAVQSDLWARGYIVLEDDKGRILHEMPQKG